jgi:hypothetical protein
MDVLASREIGRAMKLSEVPHLSCYPEGSVNKTFAAKTPHRMRCCQSPRSACPPPAMFEPACGADPVGTDPRMSKVLPFSYTRQKESRVSSKPKDSYYLKRCLKSNRIAPATTATVTRSTMATNAFLLAADSYDCTRETRLGQK